MPGSATLSSLDSVLKEYYSRHVVDAFQYHSTPLLAHSHLTPALAVSTTVLVAVTAVGWAIDRRNRLAAERAAGVVDDYVPWFVTMARAVMAALLEWIRSDRRNLLPMRARA